jgi:hypothetical protein
MVTRYSDRLLVWFLYFAAPLLVAGLFLWGWILVFALGPTRPPLLVPMGSSLLLFQGFVAVVAYGLFAERMRHLAGGRSAVGSRTVARVEPADADASMVLIQDVQARPLSRPDLSS